MGGPTTLRSGARPGKALSANDLSVRQTLSPFGAMAHRFGARERRSWTRLNRHAASAAMQDDGRDMRIALDYAGTAVTME